MEGWVPRLFRKAEANPGISEDHAFLGVAAGDKSTGNARLEIGGRLDFSSSKPIEGGSEQGVPDVAALAYARHEDPVFIPFLLPRLLRRMSPPPHRGRGMG